MAAGARHWILRRNWPAVAIVVAATALFLGIEVFHDASRQGRFLAEVPVVGIAAILLWLWCLLLSPLEWRWRGVVCGLVLATCGSLAATVRITGVTGDLYPILSWRWAAPAGPTEAPTQERSTAGEAGLLPAVDLTRVDALDYPQFLGPRRDGVVRGVRLARDWQAHPPRERWRRKVGAGWSSFAVASGHAVMLEQRGDEEAIACYELATGREAWVDRYLARYEEVIGGIGPRTTPAIDSGRVYAVGATGILSCLDGATGKPIWRKDILAENGSRNNQWGYSASPLLAGDRVVVATGGRAGKSLVAYDAASGERVGSGGDARQGYASPALATLAGVPQLLLFRHGGIAAHDVADGRVLWSHPWSTDNPTVTQPVPVGENRVLITSGYGNGAEVIEVARDAGGALEPRSVWKNRNLKSKLSNVVLREGHIYGLDDGILVCLDAATGERRWKAGRYGHGQLLLVEDLLLVQAEGGEVVLLEPVPDAHRELGRLEALRGKTWNHPAFRPPYLLVRNDEEAACFEVELAP